MADTSTTAQKVAAEVLGTFVLVFVGCGSVAFASQSVGGVDYTAVGLAFGLALTVMVYALGRVSGAHLNPAVSVGAAVGGRVPWRQLPLYVGSQLAGALLAGLVLYLLLQGYEGFRHGDTTGQNFYGDQSPTPGELTWWAAFLLELVLTTVLVLVVLAVTDTRFEHPALAPLAIGLTLAALHFVAIPATGTSVNPARSTGPAVFAGTDAMAQLWVFVLAPLLGGVLAGVLHPLLFGHGDDPVPGSGLRRRRTAPDQLQQQWNQEEWEHGQEHWQYGQEQGDQHPSTQQQWDQQAREVWEQEPIIQDGWQWDHAAQEWRPLQ